MNRTTRWPVSDDRDHPRPLGHTATAHHRRLLDGISCLRYGAWVGNDPGGPECLAAVPAKAGDAVIFAADDCPGECIFIDVDR